MSIVGLEGSSGCERLFCKIFKEALAQSGDLGFDFIFGQSAKGGSLGLYWRRSTTRGNGPNVKELTPCPPVPLVTRGISLRPLVASRDPKCPDRVPAYEGL